MECKACSAINIVLGIFTLILGAILGIVWPLISPHILHKNLVLKNGTDGFANWIEAPIPIYLKFHLFNWTNPLEIRKSDSKPIFEEMGPYVFLEKRVKQNLTFFDNGTVSYMQKRIWFFDAQRSKGSLEDMVTSPHVISATLADQTRERSELVKKVVNLILNYEGGRLYVTKSSREWIFDGFEDKLLDFLHLFNASDVRIPYNRFGWMVDRNGSLEYDGIFTVDTGVENIFKLGQLAYWKGKNYTDFYPLPCGTVNGTAGDVFSPGVDIKAPITIFATDACRYLILYPNGTTDIFGIEGTNWVGTEETLDSGLRYPSMKCFCNITNRIDCPKTGVVDCRKCRYNAPIFSSFPHFYLADQSYVDAVIGMWPDAQKHKFQLAVEPRLGVPIQVKARLQINLQIQPDEIFDIYRGIPKIMMPILWFEQNAELNKQLSDRTKFALNLSALGVYAAIFTFAVGCIMTMSGLTCIILNERSGHGTEEDEEILTTAAQD